MEKLLISYTNYVIDEAGKREENEDDHFIEKKEGIENYGIFDGRGGKGMVNKVKKLLPEKLFDNLEKNKKFYDNKIYITKIQEVIQNTFLEIETLF